jgi:hypothetical protein
MHFIGRSSVSATDHIGQSRMSMCCSKNGSIDQHSLAARVICPCTANAFDHKDDCKVDHWPEKLKLIKNNS